jgi:hypothetical protein
MSIVIVGLAWQVKNILEPKAGILLLWSIESQLAVFDISHCFGIAFFKSLIDFYLGNKRKTGIKDRKIKGE